MRQDQFLNIMPYICSEFLKLLIKKQEITKEQARKKLYSSTLYSNLKKEDTKLWQYSTPMLYMLFEQEEKTGIIQYPDV